MAIVSLFIFITLLLTNPGRLDDLAYSDDHNGNVSSTDQGFVEITRDKFKHIVNSEELTESDALNDAIQKYALHKLIVVASFDVAYSPLALNLYLTSFKRFDITNHLFLATDQEGCAKLEPRGANCLQYSNNNNTNNNMSRPSMFDSLEFNIKVCIKPRIVLDCLKRGFSVLFVDVDVVFLKNPLPFFNTCPDCDFMPQFDNRTNEVNAGFFFVRNSIGSIQLFEKVVHIIPRNPKMDQIYINQAVKEMIHTLKVCYLPTNLFQLGYSFFSEGHRVFVGDNPCEQCVVVHNNYILSLEAKIYRFKEYGLWAVDERGYYTEKNRKYIKYDNPIEFREHFRFRNNATTVMELKSLKAALMIGHILNRTVILPKFNCRGVRGYVALPEQKCHFGLHFSVRTFESYLPAFETYRESVFLEHPLVPESTKRSVSAPFLIDGPIRRRLDNPNATLTPDVRIRIPKRINVSPADIVGWFAKESAHVLQFHALYIDFVIWDTQVANFMTVLDQALQRSNVLQNK